MNERTESAPAWQQNPVFRFFASLRLAMLLLGVLIAGTVVGTICESSFDARVARAYVYDAWWFNVWLLLLCANLACSALSRQPWRRHHTGFLLTHLGIIVLLVGSLIGRRYGIEGSMTLFVGDAPSNLLIVAQHEVQLVDSDGFSQTVPVEVISRHPSPQHPWNLTTTHSGWAISAVDYSPALEVSPLMEAVRADIPGAPALHFTLATRRMGQKLDHWLLADDPGEGVFNLMGLADIEFKAGVAPDPSTDLEEMIFAFRQPQIERVVKGGHTGVRIKLADVGKDGLPSLAVTVSGTEQNIRVAPHQTVAIPGTPFSMHVEQYWPDFVLRDGKPENASNDPNNPCLLVTVTGHAVPAPEPPADPAESNGAAPSLKDAAGKNHLTVYVAGDGSLSYELVSRVQGISAGPLKLNQPLPTGWADWTLVADRSLPRAVERFQASPASPGSRQMHMEGMLIRAERGGKVMERWAAMGFPVSFPTEPGPLLLRYGNRQIPLPIALQLTNFQVDRNEGTDSPAGFKSTLNVIDQETGDVTAGQCWMNHPMSHPDSWWNTFTGLTFKISQASWNPDNLQESSVQILRDPGWSLKWIGSLVIVGGIFSLFYLRPYPMDEKRRRRMRPVEKDAAPAPAPPSPERQTVQL